MPATWPKSPSLSHQLPILIPVAPSIVKKRWLWTRGSHEVGVTQHEDERNEGIKSAGEGDGDVWCEVHTGQEKSEESVDIVTGEKHEVWGWVA